MKESSRHRRSKYSEEFKRDAIVLTEERSVSAVERFRDIILSYIPMETKAACFVSCGGRVFKP